MKKHACIQGPVFEIQKMRKGKNKKSKVKVIFEWDTDKDSIDIYAKMTEDAFAKLTRGVLPDDVSRRERLAHLTQSLFMLVVFVISKYLSDELIQFALAGMQESELSSRYIQ